MQPYQRLIVAYQTGRPCIPDFKYMLPPTVFQGFDMFEEAPTMSLRIRQEEMGNEYCYLEGTRLGRLAVSSN